MITLLSLLGLGFWMLVSTLFNAQSGAALDPVQNQEVKQIDCLQKPEPQTDLLTDTFWAIKNLIYEIGHKN